MTVSEAEKKIAEILRQLEFDTGEIVESIGCEAVEVTGLHDDRRRLRMRVVIELQRQPGRDW